MRTALFAFLLCLPLVMPAQLQDADIRMLRSIHLPNNPGLDKGMRFTSYTVAPLCIGIPAGILVYNLVQKPDGLQRTVPFVIGGSVVATSAICLGLKYAVNRPRPFATYPDITARDHVGPYSFPSAHTGNAFALATSMTLCYRKWYVAVPAFAWAFTVGYSRMRLGVHYPTDVLIGALIGAGCAWASWEIGNYIWEKNNPPQI